MNLLKSYTLFLIFTVSVLSCATTAVAGSSTGASVTVYNSGRALVNEVRTVTLPKGLASVVFKDVPTTLDPTSVRAVAKGMTVHDLQYSYLPITKNNLLDRYIGKELTVILPDPADANARILRKATLLSNEQSPIFLVGNEVYVGTYDALLLPELPKELQRESTLTLTTENKAASKQDVHLSYLMGGLTWRADYALAVDSKGDKGALEAWATLENSSGRGFVNTDLKLVAGDVKQANAPRRNFQAKGMVMMEADMMSAAPPVEESFSQYHVYSVKRPVSLAERGTKQLSLFSAPKLSIQQELISRFHGGSGQRNGPMKQTVELSLSFANVEKNGLGKPMPGGLFRVFMPTSDGSMLLAGESHVGHIGVGGDVKLVLGQAFDVSVERRQTSFKKLGKNSYEMGWKVDVVNGKESAQAVTLLDTYSGQWKVLTADQKFTMPDAGSLEFNVTVPPSKDGKPVVINYTVQVTY